MYRNKENTVTQVELIEQGRVESQEEERTFQMHSTPEGTKVMAEKVLSMSHPQVAVSSWDSLALWDLDRRRIFSAPFSFVLCCLDSGEVLHSSH